MQYLHIYLYIQYVTRWMTKNSGKETRRTNLSDCLYSIVLFTGTSLRYSAVSSTTTGVLWVAEVIVAVVVVVVVVVATVVETGSSPASSSSAALMGR